MLLLVFDDGALCLGPEDEVWRIGSGDARDAADRAAMRARYAVPPGATGLFIIDGDRRLRFSYIEVAPRQGTLHTIAAALSATGPIDMSRLTLSRRELVVSSLAAAFALALTEPPARAAPAPPAAETAAGEVEIVLQVNGEARAAHASSRASRCSTRCASAWADRHQEGLRSRPVRRLHRAVDGRRVLSCLTLAVMARGPRRSRRSRAWRSGDELHPMQAAFIEHDGFQCGYCTPGQIMIGGRRCSRRATPAATTRSASR